MGEVPPVDHIDAGLDRLRALIALFDPIAHQAKARPICWISDGNDAGTDYCPDCARWKAKHIRRHNKACREAVADGGWDTYRESDQTAFCGGCGHLLGYSLSRYALRDEIEYWDDDAWVEALTPIHAYQIRAVLYAAWVFRDFIGTAVAIGERAVSLLPPLPTAEAAHA